MKNIQNKKSVDVKAMKPVKIYSAPNQIDAEMLLEILDNNGIIAYRQGVGGGAIIDIYGGNSTLGEDIFVDEKDAENARELIESIVYEEKP